MRKAILMMLLAVVSSSAAAAWVEVGQVPEGLHEQDQARAGIRGGRGVGIAQQPRGDAAQLAQPRPVLATRTCVAIALSQEKSK